MQLFIIDLVDGQMRIKPHGDSHGVEQIWPPLFVLPGFIDKGRNSARAQRQSWVGDDQVWVEFCFRPEARTVGTSSIRGIEGEHPGFKLWHGKTTYRARIRFRKKLFGRLLLLGLAVFRAPLSRLLLFRLPMDRDKTLPHLQCSLNRIGESPLDSFFHNDPIDHHFDGVLLIAVHRNVIGHFVHLTVHAYTHKPGTIDFLKHALVFAFPSADNRSKNLEPCAFRKFHCPIHNLIRALTFDGAVAVGAMGDTGPRKEHP